MNRPTRLLSLLWFCLLLAGLLPFGAAPGHAAVAPLRAARPTSRNFVLSTDARGLLTVAFDLANTGGATATAPVTLTVSSPSAAPEPSQVAGLALTALGLGGLLLRARRRKAAPAR